MGLIINGTKMGKPYINGVKHNAYLNASKVWKEIISTEFFQFTVQDKGSFNIQLSGTNGGYAVFQPYNWHVDWGDSQTQDVSGTGSNSATIDHTYTDGVDTHTITISPNGTPAQGWFNAFGSGPNPTSLAKGNIAKIKSVLTPLTSLMRTAGEYCYSFMFSYCTGLTSIPSNFLSATTMAKYCYNRMFEHCTNLTTVPELPATTLADYCYAYMFEGCAGLTSIPANLLPATTI
jgi:hypothetical protein